MTIPKHLRIWAAWIGLLSIDVVSRAPYLSPRLTTVRGFLNYAAASLVLWLVVRLLAGVSHPKRAWIWALVIGVPMAVEWAMFKGFGQFLETTDFLAVATSPRVVFKAAGAGGDKLGALFMFALTTSIAWLLPRAAMTLPRWRVLVMSVVLIGTIATGASWWRATPSLEHSQPAFCAALAGVARHATVRSRGAHRPIISSVPPRTTTSALPNVVLVLGESLAASHLTLYGYERDTSPRLQHLHNTGNLLVFTDAVVMGPHTRTSVPYIMTGLAGPDPGGRVFTAPNMMEYAKARGYHTAFVSAQEESWGDLDAILRAGADSFRTGLHFAPEVDVLKGCDDLVLLERGVLPTVASLPEPFFLVIHMDGNHVPYTHHSPPSHKVFAEDGVNSVGAYDNTVRVTDEFVARVFDAVRARDPRAWMFFTSDHGQALGEGGAFFHRGYQANIVRDPLLVFPPTPADREQWSALTNAQVSACDLAPTILHLMDTKPSAAPMDCVDLLATIPTTRVRVVSAYTPAFLAEPTMLLLYPDGDRALFDLWRGTVSINDGATRPIAEHRLPADVAARLELKN